MKELDIWNALSVEFRRNFIVGAFLLLTAAVAVLCKVVVEQHEELIQCRRDVETSEIKAGNDRERLMREHMATLQALIDRQLNLEARLSKAEKQRKR